MPSHREHLLYLLRALLIGSDTDTHSRNGSGFAYERTAMQQRYQCHRHHHNRKRGNGMIAVDIASILIACVAANHLGLISAIEKITGLRLYIIDCPKCFTFWATLAYGIESHQDFLPMLAVSFFCAYLAIWLELGMGMID